MKMASRTLYDSDTHRIISFDEDNLIVKTICDKETKQMHPSSLNDNYVKTFKHLFNLRYHIDQNTIAMFYHKKILDVLNLPNYQEQSIVEIINNQLDIFPLRHNQLWSNEILSESGDGSFSQSPIFSQDSESNFIFYDQENIDAIINFFEGNCLILDIKNCNDGQLLRLLFIRLCLSLFHETIETKEKINGVLICGKVDQSILSDIRLMNEYLRHSNDLINITFFHNGMNNEESQEENLNFIENIPRNQKSTLPKIYSPHGYIVQYNTFSKSINSQTVKLRTDFHSNDIQIPCKKIEKWYLALCRSINFNYFQKDNLVDIIFAEEQYYSKQSIIDFISTLSANDLNIIRNNFSSIQSTSETIELPSKLTIEGKKGFLLTMVFCSINDKKIIEYDGVLEESIQCICSDLNFNFNKVEKAFYSPYAEMIVNLLDKKTNPNIIIGHLIKELSNQNEKQMLIARYIFENPIMVSGLGVPWNDIIQTYFRKNKVKELVSFLKENNLLENEDSWFCQKENMQDTIAILCNAYPTISNISILHNISESILNYWFKLMTREAKESLIRKTLSYGTRYFGYISEEAFSFLLDEINNGTNFILDDLQQTRLAINTESPQKKEKALKMIEHFGKESPFSKYLKRNVTP